MRVGSVKYYACILFVFLCMSFLIRFNHCFGHLHLQSWVANSNTVFLWYGLYSLFSYFLGGGGLWGGQRICFCVFSMLIAEDWPMYKGVLQEQKHNNLPLIEIGKLLVVYVMLCVCVFVTVCLCIVCVWQSAYMYLLHCPYALSSSNHLYPCEYCTPWPTIEILLLTLQFTSTVFLWPAFVMFWDLENNVFS